MFFYRNNPITVLAGPFYLPEVYFYMVGECINRRRACQPQGVEKIVILERWQTQTVLPLCFIVGQETK